MIEINQLRLRSAQPRVAQSRFCSSRVIWLSLELHERQRAAAEPESSDR